MAVSAITRAMPVRWRMSAIIGVRPLAGERWLPSSVPVTSGATRGAAPVLRCADYVGHHTTRSADRNGGHGGNGRIGAGPTHPDGAIEAVRVPLAIRQDPAARLLPRGCRY